MGDSGADRLQMFIASVANLAGDEARKAKLLYVRNELTDLRASNDQARSFGVLQIAFAVIPFFWPFLLVQRHAMMTGAKQRADRIQNALDVWKSDLGDELPALESALAAARHDSPRLLPFARKPKQLTA